ncbi:MAG TPA: hypothetical protein VF875_05245 [Anaeromyxobacter sp.]
MPKERKTPRKEAPSKEAPRTDLTPEREPYYEGYFGTEEEEGVVREEQAPDDAPARSPHEEDAAGGDREI